MTNDWDDFIDGLAGEPTPVASRPETHKVKFKCVECNGTGKWQGGRMNVHGNSNCWTCGGRGFTMTDPRKLRDNRIKAAAKKQETISGFREENAEVIAILTKAASWSSFAASLVDQLNSKPWSDKQLAAARGMAAKIAAKDEERAKEQKARDAAAPVVDLAPIKAMFEAIAAHGYKRPKYRAEGVILSLAPAHGANAGHLYVTDEEDTYLGKITPDMKFKGTRSASETTEKALFAIAADPMGAAVRYGNRTGRCACCGRGLTNDESITRGIGPICAERWGLLDVKNALTKEEAKATLDGQKRDLLN